MKKRLLPIILFAVLSLVGCKGGKSSSSSSVVPPDSSSTITGTISITNKDELTAEWKATEAGRNVKLAVQPNTNITQAVSKGEITITSSDATVVAANGLLLTPLKEGSATITATYVAYNVSDTVTITVLPAATEPDVITGATLKQILEAKLIHTQLYEIEVEITGYQSGKTDFTKYGNFMVKDSSVTDSVLVYGATAKTDAFTFDGGVYKFTNPQDFLTNEVTKGIKIGDTVKMRVDYFEYSTTPELEGIVLEVKPAAVIPATSIAITAPAADVEVGFKTSLVYTYEPATANDYAVTWSVNDDTLAYIDSSKGDLYGKKTGTVTVTAALKSNPEVKGTLDVEIKAATLTEPEYLTALSIVETEVALGVLQTNTHKQYYALSELSDRYLKTTEISTSAHKFRVVPVEGGVNVKVDDTKYLGLGLNTDNKAAVLISETAYLFKWNDIANTLTGTIGEDTYYMGTYGTYNTVSVSKLDYLIKEGALVYGQCPLRLYAGKLPTPTPTPDPEPDPVQSDPLNLDFSKNSGLSKDMVEVNSTFTIGTMTFGYLGGKQGINYSTNANEYLMLYSGKKGSFWNETAYERVIKSITITTGSSSSEAAVYSLTVGSEMLQGYQAKNTNADFAQVIGKGKTHTYDLTGLNATFFNFSAYTKNCQISKMVVVLADA